MKKTEIALLLLIIAASAIAAYLIGKAVVGEPQKRSVSVEVVEPIRSTVVQPSSKVFNPQAINPTVRITIGQPSNQQPFNGN